MSWRTSGRRVTIPEPRGKLSEKEVGGQSRDFVAATGLVSVGEGG